MQTQRLVRLILVALCLVSSSAFADEMKTIPLNIEIYDERALDFIDPKAKLEQKASGFKWSEGPLWIESGNYWLFSDVPNNRIMKYSDTEGLSTYLQPSGATGVKKHDSASGSNGLLLNSSGELVILQHGDRRVVVMDSSLVEPKAKFKILASQYDGKRFNSPNDAIYHSNGDLYFTDPPYGLEGGMNSQYKELDFQGVFKLSPSGEVSLLDKSLTYPNGIIFNQDETQVIVAVSDSKMPKWVVFDVTNNGMLVNKRLFFDPSTIEHKTKARGLPDGLKLHSSGNIFATGPGGIYIFAPNGDLMAHVKLDKATANLAFSQDEKRLFLTSHDVVYELELK